MIFFLSKLLPQLLLPTGLVIIALLMALWRRQRRYIIIAIALSWLGATPWISHILASYGEQGQNYQAPASLPTAQAIVVLSGGRSLSLQANSSQPTPFVLNEWKDGDRFWGGVNLYSAGRAPLLIFTAGQLPWEQTDESEGEIYRNAAVRLGIDPKVIKLTPQVSNTKEEARAVANLLSQSPHESSKPISILLVTSAFHMERALDEFRQAGLGPIPFPVDFRQGYQPQLTFYDFIPAAYNYQLSELMLRELLGRLVNRLVYGSHVLKESLRWLF